MNILVKRDLSKSLLNAILTRTFTTGAVALGALAGLLGVQSSASAGLISGFTGYSVFGNGTDGPGSIPCPACDSTVYFAAIENTGIGLTQELLNLRFISDSDEIITRAGTFDNTDKYLFIYQVINTDPVPTSATNQELENFNVTKTDGAGNPFNEQPYTAAGYFNNSQLFILPQNAAVTPIDNPVNDWIPSEDNLPLNLESGGMGVDLAGAELPNVFTISSAAIRGGVPEYTGAELEFAVIGGGTIPGAAQGVTGGTSKLLFLTADSGIVDYVWAETESPGGFGAVGDVVGIKNVPEPNALLGLLALGGIGFLRKTQKQK